MRKNLFVLLLLFFCSVLSAYAQWQKVSSYPVNNEQFIEGYAFITADEGFMAVNDYLGDDFIGYTTNGGATYTKRNIVVPELPLGMTLDGVYLNSSNTLFAFGSYILLPVIVKSVDKGLTWQLVYAAPANTTPLPQYVVDMQFVSASVGFAIHQKQLLKTTNGGNTWNAVGTSITGIMRELSFVSETEGYIAGENGLYKVSTTSSTITLVNSLAGSEVYNVFATGTNKLYVYTSNGIYQSLNGSTSFTKKTIPEAPLDFSLSQWHFFNDSTGIAQMGNGIYKTNTSGQTWDRMIGVPDNPSSSYTFQALYFYDQQTAYQSVSGPGTFRTTNQGGTPLPESVFRTDLSQLSTQNKVSLNNLSSKGYTYTWTKNGQLLSNDYSTSYISNRLQKDTIRLIVTNASGSDTSVQFVETRMPNYTCISSAVLIKDTSTVKLTPNDTALDYRTHEWQMGNGVTLYDVKPVYQYPQKGTYIIRHIIRDPISGCTSQSSFQVIISKLTNCDAAVNNINPVLLDTFANNTFTFYNQQKDFAGETMERFTWFFGDGDSATFSSVPTHAYTNSGQYNIKVVLQFNGGKCYKEFYDTLQVQLADCTGKIRIKRSYGSEKYDFEGKPLDKANQKKHTWILDNKDIISTGSTPFLQHKYSSGLVNYAVQYCYSTPLYQLHNLDSANRLIRHIVVDTITGCRTEDSINLTLDFDGNALELWQSKNNPYEINYLTRGNIRCVTQEGIQSRGGPFYSGDLYGQWGYPVHGTYAINASFQTSTVVDIYRRTIKIDGEYRYFQQGQGKNEIIGHIYIDANKNGIKDPTEKPYTQLAKITGTVNSKSSIAYSEKGSFRLTTDSGLVNIQLTLAKSHYTVTPSNITINFTKKIGVSDTVNIGLQPITKVKDGMVSIVPNSPARPGFRAYYSIPVKNTGNDTIYNAKLKLVKDPRIIIDSLKPAASSISNDSITWSIGTLLPNPDSVFTIKISGTVAVPPTVNGGDTLRYGILLNGYTGEIDATDNEYKYNQLVVNAYDPNDKRDNRAGIMRKTEIDSTAWIYYMIRFQNTGNAAAYNVILRDTLESKLNWGSFEMIESSHSNKVTVENNNQVCWLFKNIMLPDSTRDKAGSNGYVLFRIKANANLLPGDTIRNKASIYFDYNLPIVTNQSKISIRSVDVVTGISGIQLLEGSLKIAPNPAKNIAQLVIKAKLKGQSSVILRSWDGKLIWEKTIASINNEQIIIPINLEKLSSGVYFVTVINQGKILTQQFVLQ
ncbi:PKD domain-containing protein [Lacibacter sp. H375]|uniref:DUF7619 domain-containing protein n=1 Tax=Lacibacter sp. H375 TaxID=3133424 RepID=UPI0030C1690D